MMPEYWKLEFAAIKEDLWWIILPIKWLVKLRWKHILVFCLLKWITCIISIILFPLLPLWFFIWEDLVE